jgi:hypothetical protein
MTPRILNDDIEKEHAEEGNQAKCEGRKKRKKEKNNGTDAIYLNREKEKGPASLSLQTKLLPTETHLGS